MTVQATNIPETPQLPDLEPGVTLLEEDGRFPRSLYPLAVDTVLLDGGTGVWIDPGPTARSQQLLDVAPSDRILDRFRVARAFTAFQHLALVEVLPELIDSATSIVVVPGIDRYYRDDDLMADEGTEMMLRAVAVLAGTARARDLPVLLTRTNDGEFTEPIANAAEERLRCEDTPVGPRFVGPDTETLVYDCGSGMVQTTLAFWREVLQARRPLYENANAPEVIVHGTN